VLTHLLEVRQRCLLSFQDGAHPSECGAFQALASVQRVAVLDHAYHIPCHGIDQLPGRIDLSQCQFVMITIVQRITQVGVEGVNVGQSGKVGYHGREAFANRLLCEFDLAHAGGCVYRHEGERAKKRQLRLEDRREG